MEIVIRENIMQNNEETAALNQKQFNSSGTYALNLLGSPGSGKTTLLEKTLEKLAGRIKTAVIEGDLYTSKDADRIKKYGAPVVQINTVGGCHLDARMVARVIPEFNLEDTDLMIIENVGNLVCPAAYSLGEHDKAVVLSVAEGGDKPLKYPRIFLESKAAVLHKTDLLPFTDVDPAQLKEDILSINPQMKIFEVSSRTGTGLDPWTDWLVERVLAHGGNKEVTG